MTTFQGQSAKRHSNKKNFKSGQNQPNAIFCFITFRNHRQKNSMLFHIYKSHRFRKWNQNRAPELGIPAEWQHSKVSQRNVTQTRKTKDEVKIKQMLYYFHNICWVQGRSEGGVGVKPLLEFFILQKNSLNISWEINCFRILVLLVTLLTSWKYHYHWITLRVSFKELWEWAKE